MLGVTLPASMSVGEPLLVAGAFLAASIVSRWRTNGERSGARSDRPKPPVHLPPSSPPTMTSVPVGVSALRRRDSEALPAMSRMRS